MRRRRRGRRTRAAGVLRGRRPRRRGPAAWNATGKRFVEGRERPLPRRISPAVKRADKCIVHLRQHRPGRRPRPRPSRPAALPLHSSTHCIELENKSDAAPGAGGLGSEHKRTCRCSNR